MAADLEDTEMTRTSGIRFGLCAAAVALMLVAAPVMADKGGLQVADAEAAGSQVQVTVTNAEPVSASAKVRVTVRLVGGFVASAVAGVDVAAKGSATMTAEFGVPVSEILEAGVIDDQNPI